MKEIKYHFQLLKYRIKGLRPELKLFLLLSIISILVIELFLNKIPAVYQIQYDLGRIYIRLCYAYFSAFIFYYLIVYNPKERKRVKAFRLINNTVHLIIQQKDGILLNIIRVSEPNTKLIDENITLLQLKKYCEIINPNEPITFHRKQNIIHPTFYEFLSYRIGKLKSYIDELIAINELIDDDLFQNITNINNILSDSLIIDKVDQIYMTDLEFLSHGFYNLHFEVNELKSIFFKNYKPRYNFQYHYNERKRNKKLKLK